MFAKVAKFSQFHITSWHLNTVEERDANDVETRGLEKLRKRDSQKLC